MINIDTFKTFVYFIANKSGRGTIAPTQFNSATSRALMSWTTSQYSNEKEYVQGLPLPRTYFEMNQRTIDTMRHLKEERMISVSNNKLVLPDGETTKDTNGDATPKYWHLSALRKYLPGSGIGNETDIEIIKDDELGIRLNSKIVEPTNKKPVGNVQNNYINIYPEGTNYVKLVYLRYPNTPVWAYTTANGRPVYDSSNSVDLDAPDEAFNEIAMQTLSFMGIHIREDELVQYSEGLKDKGV